MCSRYPQLYQKKQVYKDDVTFTNKTSGSMYYFQALAVTPDPESTWICGIGEASDKLNDNWIMVKSKSKNLQTIHL